MADIKIGDTTVSVSDDSLLTRSTLSKIAAGSISLSGRMQQSIQGVDFHSASLGAQFATPKIPLDSSASLTISAGTNCTLTRYTAKDGALFGSSPTVPKVAIGAGEYWLSFGLQSTLNAQATGPVAPGFCVSLKLGSAIKLTEYTKFSADHAPLPTFGEAIGTTLSNFGLLRSASDLRQQKTGTIRASDISGTVTVSGSYSLPISVNQLALSESLVPFKVQVSPALAVKAGGSVAVTGDYSVICWRSSDTEAVLALMKKQGTTLTATFTAGAGLVVDANSTDLLETFFKAVAPGADLKESGIAGNDARCGEINKVLTDSISRTFSISINAGCSAAFSDEAALMYSIDLNEGDSTATDKALNSAVAGNWSLLSALPNAKELRNIVGDSRETKSVVSVNLLGIYNYESVADFIRSSQVVHDPTTGSVTITDKATAGRITVASSPLHADTEKLRTVVDEATIATAAFGLASGKLSSQFQIKQSLLIYQDKMSTGDLRKKLRLATAIDELTAAQLAAIQMDRPRHVLIDAGQSFEGDRIFRLFFSDTKTYTPHTPDELILIGRRTLAALLDPSEPSDARRIAVLLGNDAWKTMDDAGGKPPSDSPGSYTDWYTVKFWANAMSNAAGPLKAVLLALQGLPAGADPSTDPALTKSRKALRAKLGDVTHKLHDPFDPGWPIAVMYALAGRNTGAALKATWNGVQVLPAAHAIPPAIVSFAKAIATQAVSESNESE